MTYDELERIKTKIYPNTISGKNENVTYTYDGQGCPSVAGAGSTGATDAGRLYQLTQAGTLKAEYIYNDMGQGTKKILYQADGITVDTTTIYHYDQMGQLITETGTLIKDYIWNEMHPVAQIDAVTPAKPVPKQACPRESGGGDRNPVNRNHYLSLHRSSNDCKTGNE